VYSCKIINTSMADCIFCRIVNKEIPSKIVYEDENVIAFDDINPQAPIHTLVVPKKHINTVMELEDYEVVSNIFRAIKKVAEIKNIDKDGFRVVVNHLSKGGQSVYISMYWVVGRCCGHLDSVGIIIN